MRALNVVCSVVLLTSGSRYAPGVALIDRAARAGVVLSVLWIVYLVMRRGTARRSHPTFSEETAGASDRVWLMRESRKRTETR